MVFHQTIKTCAPELVEDDTPITLTVRYKDAVTFEEQEVVVPTTFGSLLGNESALFYKGAAVFEYAEALKALKNTYDDDERAVIIQGALDEVGAALPGDEDLLQIQGVLQAL
jgi:hypothetical protein